MSMILTLGGLSVTITKFTEPSFPRVPAIETAKLEYSIHGNPIGTGAWYEAPHLWSFGAICTPHEADIISAIYSDFEAQRRAGKNAFIRLDDKVQEFVEKAPRTRALAVEASERAIGTTHVSYYAQFLVWFTQFPQQEIALGKRIIRLSLQETIKI